MVTNWRYFKCPFCGLDIRANDNARELQHRVPVCERYLAECKASGGKPNGVAIEKPGDNPAKRSN